MRLGADLAGGAGGAAEKDSSTGRHGESRSVNSVPVLRSGIQRAVVR